MIWNLMFWFGVAYLAIAIVWRFFVPAFSVAPARDGEGSSSGAKRFFAGSKVFPVVAVIFLAIPLAIQAANGLSGQNWTDDEKAGLEHFRGAMEYYDQATQLATVPALKTEDWETIKALLEASQAEAVEVGDTVLSKLDADMPAVYSEQFLSGLRMGIFGLAQHNLGVPKGQKELAFHAQDSLKLGRELLADWDAWYLPRRNSINQELSKAIPRD